MLDDTQTVEAVVCTELKKLREAERWLWAAFEKLPVERLPPNSINRFMYPWLKRTSAWIASSSCWTSWKTHRL